MCWKVLDLNGWRRRSRPLPQIWTPHCSVRVTTTCTDLCRVWIARCEEADPATSRRQVTAPAEQLAQWTARAASTARRYTQAYGAPWSFQQGKQCDGGGSSRAGHGASLQGPPPVARRRRQLALMRPAAPPTLHLPVAQPAFQGATCHT